MLYKFYFTLVVVFLIANTAFSQDEFQRIEDHITAYLKADINIPNLNKDVSENKNTIQNNGNWLDIDYTSTAETNWIPLLHLKRLKQFASYISLNNESNAESKNLSIKTITGLRYWLQVNPSSKNWFQNEIASPTAIGEILVLLKGKNILPLPLQDSLLTSMKQGDVNKAIGANKLDIATHIIYRACIVRDKDLMKFAVNQAFMPITLTNKEGLQPDYSYRQHGPQLQIASYGQVFLTGEYKVASWLVGTGYALPAEKLKILDHYLINTYLKTIRGRYIDFNTEGRGISRNDVLDKLNITSKVGTQSLLSLAKEASLQNLPDLVAAEERISQNQSATYKIKPSHSYFYKSDYTLHNREAYSFNVRTVSKRTIRTEYGNKENLLGKFLPDGSTNIQRSGSEYFNIMPIWEWDKIPGITARDYATDQKMSLEWGERGVGEFIGGTSDGIYGTTVYSLNYNEVTAKKAWFFFDDEVVCLGTDINSYAKEPITTSVNQAWLKGEVKAFANDKLISATNGFTNDNVEWLWHDSVGYYFPNRGNINLTTNEQEGSWAKINANRSVTTIKGKVFKLWFNHGLDPVNQSYAYIVKPGISQVEMKSKPISTIKIVSNTPLIQAVEHSDLNMLQVVFYEAGTLTSDGAVITVNQPCVVLIKNINTQNPIFSVSDPTQKLTDLTINFNSTLIKTTDPLSVSLPQGDYKGSTVSLKFNSL
ncbi:MAG: polysaccharide lyase family 8 super-sandwich domain-containing protein [Bacteroidota bacterium]